MIGGLLLCLLLIPGCLSQRRSPNADRVPIIIAKNPGLYYSDVQDDAFLDAPNLLRKYGYLVEIHHVVTSDGYILEVHRIPYGRNHHDSPGRNKTVVFLMHGLLCSSADWILMGPEKGLGYILADNGYDVWMGNARGNYYSRHHRSLGPNDSKFWQFSWHEIGVFDLPAMVDYVLAQTKRTKIHYVGHSQGTTTFVVMASIRPEYNAKFQSVNFLAPAIIMTHASSPIIRILGPISNTVGALVSLIGINEFLPDTELTRRLAERLCKNKSMVQEMCSNSLFLLCGYDEKQLNLTMLPVIFAHTPAGASAKQLVHYGQGYESGIFRQFDYGFARNLLRYKWPFPPAYDISAVTAPVAMHYSDNDWFVDTGDVAKVYNLLGNPIGKYRVSLRQFNHMDFLYAIDARKLVYDKVMEIIAKYNTIY